MTVLADPSAWPNAPVLRVCVCGCLEVLHNLSASGRRTGCSVSNGPKATPCGCKAFSPAPVTELTGQTPQESQ